MNILINNKSFILNTQRAIELGVLIEEKKYTVELTSQEVETLRLLCRRVGGLAATTPRGFTDSVLKKLPLVELSPLVNFNDFTIEGGITFRPKNP